MDRLTAWDNGNAYFPKCFEDPCGGNGTENDCDDCDFMVDVCRKLAQYEDIGTLEEFKFLKENRFTHTELAEIACGLNRLAKYEDIGTLEEVRDAVERQKAKKAEKISKGDKLRFGTCPCCERRISTVEGGNYCQNCGQRLEWSEEE